jgi:hypothetical protein
MIQSIDNVLPAKVINFKSGPPDYVQVQPLIKVLGTDGASVSRAQISSVPVCQIGGGGYVIRFNIMPGDHGLLIACDRDISLYMQSGQESQPNTYRKKDFSDSFFLPIVMRDYLINSEDMGNAVLQNIGGSIRISLFSDKVKITGNSEFADDVLIAGNLTVSGKIKVLGDINCGGNITAAGTITPGIPLPP